MAVSIKAFSTQKDKLGEGPLWNPDGERLYWMDSYGPAVHRADLKGSAMALNPIQASGGRRD